MNKGNLIITVGISNSGKSTWAHEQWVKNPAKFTIVNRDKIRELLFGFTEQSVDEYYHMEGVAGFEKQITRYEDTLIHEGLNSGKTVIVDATNLTRTYLERYKYWNVPTKVMIFEIELDKAIERNSSRARMVDEGIIHKQYSRFVAMMQRLSNEPIDFTPVEINQNPDNEPCILFDIDGTLSHMNSKLRSPYDWDKVGLDTPDEATVRVLKNINTARMYPSRVIICTGRDGVCIDETETWLLHNGITYYDIYIRPKGDQRPDWVVKEEMWRKIAEDNYIVGMFDDRLQVVRRARALGLKVFNVEYNNF